MILQVIIACKLVAYEQGLKEKFGGLNLCDSDLIFRGKILRNVLGLGFGGGWVAGALGLGGGVIFNPLLLSMGVPAKVSSATGMYLITFSKIVTCVIYFIYGELVMDYALWAGFLTLILGLSVIGVPLFGGMNLKKEADGGKDIY